MSKINYIIALTNLEEFFVFFLINLNVQISFKEQIVLFIYCVPFRKGFRVYKTGKNLSISISLLIDFKVVLALLKGAIPKLVDSYSW